MSDRKEYQQKYRAENKEKIKAYLKSRRAQINERDKAHYQRTKDKHRDTWFKRKYDITLEVYNTLLTKQNHVCAICLKPEETKDKKGNFKKLAIDHNHQSGHVRGLLCQKCNQGIGLLGESVFILDSAKKYLYGSNN
jgi:hypothetical protein